VIPSVTCLRLSDASIICRVIFSFHFNLLFFHVRSQAAAAAYVVYPILDIGHCRKCGKYIPCTQQTAQRKDFEFILIVKMETRHPIEGYFGSEFQAICNNCRVMAAWSCKTWKFWEQFLHFFGKTTHYDKIVKILFWKFSPPYWLTLLCSNFVNCCRWEICEIARYLLDQKSGWLPL